MHAMGGLHENESVLDGNKAELLCQNLCRGEVVEVGGFGFALESGELFSYEVAGNARSLSGSALYEG